MSAATLATDHLVCTRCHGACAVASYPVPAPAVRLPAAGTDEHGRTVCDGCIALATRWALTDGRPDFGYVSSDGRAITSWGGAHIARIIRSTSYRNNIGAEVLCWTAELPNGRRCYGRNGGRGMCTRIRPARVRSEVTR